MSLVCVKRLLPLPLAKAIKKRRRRSGALDGPESGAAAAVVKWSLNSREISEPRSLLPLAHSVGRSVGRPPLSCSSLAATAQRNDFWLRWAHLGPGRRRRRRRRARAGGHSINDNLLASSSHCQLALNYDIIDPNLTSGGGGLPPVRRSGRRGEYALSRRAVPGRFFRTVVVVVGSIIIIIYPHFLCIGTAPDRGTKV